MKNETIQIAIDILTLAIRAEESGNFELKYELLGSVINTLSGVKAKDGQLTKQEIFAGQTQGKLTCVKMVKERTMMSLMDVKKMVEKFFMDNGYQFDMR